MITLNSDFYDSLAQELITQIADRGFDEGVVEVPIGTNAHVVFAFSNVDYTLECGISSMSYLVLGFKDGRRDSTDFCAERLDEKVTR